MSNPVHGQPPDGPIYSKGSGFRARAERLARRFRVEELRVGHREYGHLLEEQASASGANFSHPAALAAAETRAAQGKGVDRVRTFGNMLSSQALCFNLFAPLALDRGGLDIAREVLAPFIPTLTRVRSIEIEYTPPPDVFRDQSGFSGVDCDALIEFEEGDQLGVLVIETKFVERSFSKCGHCSKHNCPDDVLIGNDFAGCRYSSTNNFAYWQRTAETQSLHLTFIDQSGCPFGGPLWQIWVNHTLAYVEAKRRGAHRAVCAVCAPEGNDSLQARALLERYRQHATDAESVVFIPLERLLDQIVEASAMRVAWNTWANLLRQRYAVASQRA